MSNSDDDLGVKWQWWDESSSSWLGLYTVDILGLEKTKKGGLGPI